MGIDKNIREEIRTGKQPIPEEYKRSYPNVYPLVSSMMTNT